MDTAVPLQAEGQSQSIEELEGVIWFDPASRSHVVQTSHALRRKPLRDLTDEELRVGLEQQVGLRFLVPLAVERLQSEPLLEARIYAGDLLQSLLLVPPDFWRRNADLRESAAGVASAALGLAARRTNSWRREILPELREPHDLFSGKLPPRQWLRPNGGAAAPSSNEPPGVIAG